MTDGVESRMLREIMARTSTDKRLNSADELTRLRTENAALRATLKQAREALSGVCTVLENIGGEHVTGLERSGTRLEAAWCAIAAIDKVQP